ncbi:MAG: mechanosensitive ion channel family protein [Thiohalospira sp.]
MDPQALLSSIQWQPLLATGLRLVLILAIAWGALRLLRSALNRMERRLVERATADDEGGQEAAKRAGTLTRLLHQAGAIAIAVVVGMVVLREIGVDIAPLLAGAGILGLAVGFGAQNLVRDVITGFFFILENQIRVGDVAIINGTAGVVERLNFRTVVLRDLAGTVHVLPNGAVTSVSNMTKEWSAYVLDIGVSYRADPDAVIAIMHRVGEELRADDYFGPLIPQPVEVFGLNEFAESAIVIKGRIITRPGHQWECGREYLKRLKRAFEEAGVEIPYPHRSIEVRDAHGPTTARLLEAEGAESSGE